MRDIRVSRENIGVEQANIRHSPIKRERTAVKRDIIR